MLLGLLALLTLTLGLRDTRAEQAAATSLIVGQHNRFAQPRLTTTTLPRAAIRLPRMAATSRNTQPTLGSSNAIQVPQLAVARHSILGPANAFPQPTLAIANTPFSDRPMRPSDTEVIPAPDRDKQRRGGGWFPNHCRHRRREYLQSTNLEIVSVNNRYGQPLTAPSVKPEMNRSRK